MLFISVLMQIRRYLSRHPLRQATFPPSRAYILYITKHDAEGVPLCRMESPPLGGFRGSSKTDIFEIDDEGKKLFITQTASKTGLPAVVVEKDLWVTVVLQLVFQLPFADKVIFKGGSSLSNLDYSWELNIPALSFCLTYNYHIIPHVILHRRELMNNSWQFVFKINLMNNLS